MQRGGNGKLIGKDLLVHVSVCRRARVCAVKTRRSDGCIRTKNDRVRALAGDQGRLEAKHRTIVAYFDRHIPRINRSGRWTFALTRLRTRARRWAPRRLQYAPAVGNLKNST